jgi:hypothetical protein
LQLSTLCDGKAGQFTWAHVTKNLSCHPHLQGDDVRLAYFNILWQILPTSSSKSAITAETFISEDFQMEPRVRNIHDNFVFQNLNTNCSQFKADVHQTIRVQLHPQRWAKPNSVGEHSAVLSTAGRGQLADQARPAAATLPQSSNLPPETCHSSNTPAGVKVNSNAELCRLDFLCHFVYKLLLHELGSTHCPIEQKETFKIV